LEYEEGLSLSLFARAIECRPAGLNDPRDAAGFAHVAGAARAGFPFTVVNGEIVLEIAQFAIVMHEIPQR
jgi:hypothetical protein